MQPDTQDVRIRSIITAGLLAAITLLLALTPVGFIPVPTPAGSATIAHIPAIIAGILEGPLVGLIVSLSFGVASFLSPLVPVKDPLVIVLPRLLIGVVAAWVYQGLRRSSTTTLTVLLAVVVAFILYAAYEIAQLYLWLGIAVAVVTVIGALFIARWLQRQEVVVVSLAAAGIAGSLTNTVLVLTAAVLRQVPGITSEVALGIGLSQGIPEAVVSAIVVVIVVGAIRQIGTRQRGSRI